MPGVFLIEDKKVKNLYKYKTIADNPKLLEVVIDPSEDGCSSDSFCDLSGSVNRFLPRKSTVEIPDTTTSTTIDIDNQQTPESFNMDNIEKELGLDQPESNTTELPSLTAALDPYRRLQQQQSNSKSRFSCFGSTVKVEPIPQHVIDSVDLESLLANSKSRRYFKVYCASEYSVENILFWEAVHIYRRTKETDTTKTLAIQIMQTFLKKGSPNEVNTSRKLITAITTRFASEGAVLDLFDSIVKDVVTECLNDTFSRFRRTDEFLEVVNVIVFNKQ
jgi:hypothetical protein